MTRLTEALERARLVPRAAPGAAPAGTTHVGVPPTWQFDATDDATPAAPQVAQASSIGLATDAPGIQDDKLVGSDHADAAIVEQYRCLAAVLHQAQNRSGLRSVMVGSALGAEGKTLTATNLALTLSRSFRRRTLLIDADLRRPGLHALLRIPNDQGLVESLRAPQSSRLPIRAVSTNLWVLPAGRPAADPMSSLVSDTMKQLLADAVEQFDWVIVDTPPVAMMPDANLLAQMIDGALLVIRANATPYPLVRRAAAAIGPARILGVVLNCADRTELAQGYEYYKQYGHAAGKPASKRFRLFSN